MNTGKTVKEEGLYSTDCCEKEHLYYAQDTFRRCPACMGLCEWDLVDEVEPGEFEEIQAMAA